MFGDKFDPKAITEAGGDGDLKDRNYFWDGIILYLGSVILALTAFDAAFEYVRGSGLTCFGSDGADPGPYINTVCGDSLPLTQYLPPFLYVQALAIVVPHFVFTATVGGQLDYFFSVVKKLKKGDDKFSRSNIEIVRRLRSSFTKYKRNSIYWFYIGKLILQLLFTIGTLVMLILLFTDYHIVFPCPRNLNELNTTEFPLTKPITCVFRSLSLLFYFKLLDFALIGLIFFAIFRGFLFCANGHPNELQLKSVAKFAYQSGISHKMYEPPESWYMPGFLRRCYTFLPIQLRLLSPPRISTDFDFILLKLFRTNAGMGRLFKDILIELVTRNEMDNEKIAVKLFYAYRKDIRLDNLDIMQFAVNGLKLDKLKLVANGFNISYTRYYWLPVEAATSAKTDTLTRTLHYFVESDSDLCWKEESLMIYSKRPIKPATSDELDTSESVKHLTVPHTIRGTILGLSDLAPSKMATLTITFEKSGYAEALERLFYKTASIVFTKGQGLKSSPTVSDVKISKENLRVDVTCPENAIVADLVQEEKGKEMKGFTSSEKKKAKLIDCMDPIWKDEDDDDGETITRTSFIAIGPMNKKQSRKIALLLEQLCSTDEYLENGCVIVTMTPVRISCRYTKEYFSSLNQPPRNCTELNLDIETVKTKQPLEWPPSRKKERSFGIEMAQEAIKEVSEKAQLLKSSSSGRRRRHREWTNLQCGDVDTDFEIHAYRFCIDS